MDLTPSPQEEAFREKARAWLAANVPEPFDGEHSIEDPDFVPYLRAWQRRLAEGGWLGLTWPREFGGQGLGPIDQFIFDEELAAAAAPQIIGQVGLALIGPTIAMLGTPDQKARFLDTMLLGEEVWAQGFSEPNAGSDLGSLACRAVRDGDEFIVNGQKTWTSYAQVSDWIFLLVRTDPDAPKYQGITCLLVDMKSEGVSVRPLRMMSGDSAFNEVFFSDVRVPVENVLGQIDGGWKVAITALMHERANLGGVAAVQLAQYLQTVIDIARRRGLADDPVIRQKLAQSILELDVYRMTTARALSAVGKGQAPGPEGSILKLFWSNSNQSLVQTALEIAGPYGQQAAGDYEDATYQYLRSRGNSIEAGTNEVLKNTIANRVLGLPKSY
jgi:alkylation response protein AidB-like acyl-CoA dehydrogenase